MTEFKVGLQLECVDTSSKSITAGKKYTISEMIGFGMIRIKNDDGVELGYHRSKFKPVFTPEYFSALNSSEAEKYIGKVMEFEDGHKLYKSKEHGTLYKFSAWGNKEKLIKIDKLRGDMFVAENLNWQFCRTCPETFETEGEDKVTTKPKDVKSILHGDLVEHLVTKKCNCQETYFKINIETKMKNIKHWFCPAHGYKKI